MTPSSSHLASISCSNQSSLCAGSPETLEPHGNECLQGFRQCVEVVGVDSNGPPPRKQWIYWSMDLNPSNSDVGPGVFFAIELAPSSRDEAGNLLPPGWVGLGWSQIGPEHHPPQMINGTYVPSLAGSPPHDCSVGAAYRSTPVPISAVCPVTDWDSLNGCRLLHVLMNCCLY